MAGLGRVISADSHMVEPPDLWTERLDKKYRDAAPKVEETRGGFMFGGGGSTLFPVAGGYAAGRSGRDLREFMINEQRATLYEGARPSGWDPAERLKDQDVDGVCAEVLYPSLGLVLFSMTEAELQRESFNVYNRWLAEFASHDSKRLHGIAMISLEDVDKAVEDLTEAKKLGLKGAMVWAEPPDNRPFFGDSFDKFWAAAEELEMPVSLHVVTAARRNDRDRNSGGLYEQDPQRAKFTYVIGFANVQQQIQRSLTALIFGGVFERFPKLKIVSAEHDIGWIPHFRYRLDHTYEKYKELYRLNHLQHMPSVYLQRNIWATFQDDPVGPQFAETYGKDNFMWASDFPHSDSTWPHSQEIIARDIGGLAPETMRNIVFNNAAKLYHIDV